MNTIVCSFYHLINLDDKNKVQEALKMHCSENNIKGTILVAKDGINGTIAAAKQEIENFIVFLKLQLGVETLSEYKLSKCDFIPFSKMKVLIREEVVSLRSDLELDLTLKPIDLNSDEWDDLLSNKETQLIDTRNDYEVQIGMFKNAINPYINNFRDFKDYLNDAELDLTKPTAIYCTGGIRCEKAGIYMRNLGFQKVYQLKGGILKYFEDTGNTEGRWVGDCFVFDDRISVNDKLEPGKLRCIHCLEAINTNEEKKSVTKGRIVCNKCK